MVINAHLLSLPAQGTPPLPQKIHPTEMSNKDRSMFGEEHRLNFCWERRKTDTVMKTDTQK